MTDSWQYGEAAGSVEPARFPWPPLEDESITGAFGATWRGATIDPAATFRTIPRSGGIGPAVLFFLVIGMLVAGANLFWEMTSILTLPAGFEEELSAALDTPPIQPVVGFLFTPLFLLGTLFVSAGVVHLILMMVGGARHGFGTTVRVFCYAYAPQIFAVVPFIGGIVGTIWMVVVAIIGLREAHETDGWKAGVAVLTPFVLMLGAAFMFLVLVMAAGSAVLLG